MSEELMAANDGMETPVESAPTEETTVESTDAVSEDETSYEENTSEETAEGDVNVPLHENPRFKEVYQNMKTYREELEQLKSQLQQPQAPVQETPYQPAPQIPQQYPDWVFNQEGELIPEAFMQFSAQQAQMAARQELERAKTEDKVWGDTYKEFPQLKENPSLKSIVENAAFAEYQRTGKAVHPKDVAAQIFGEVKKARQEGAGIAQANAKVVNNAYLETNSPASNRDKTLTNADLAKATPEQIHQWEVNGDLDRALSAGTLKGTPLF